MTSKQTQSLKIPKIIQHSGKLIAYFSTKLTTLFTAKLFMSPIKHEIPKREFEINGKSTQTWIGIQKINKKVILYQYGKSDKKILLVHGW